MSLQATIALAETPGLSSVVNELVSLYQAVQNMQLYREQCLQLSYRCNLLVGTLRDFTGEQMAVVEEVESIIVRARKKVQDWASQSILKSFINQRDINATLDRLYEDINVCMARFHIESVGRGLQDIFAVRARDKAEMKGTTLRIIQDKDNLNAIIGMQEQDVLQVMRTLQEELHNNDLSPTDSLIIQESLLRIYNERQLLPPLTDLTGQVKRTGDFPFTCGPYSDIYVGQWLGERKIALRLTRGLNHSKSARERFHDEVGKWRELRHPYVLQHYGIVYFGEHIYSVCPWMEQGDVMTYIKRSRHVDRMKIVGEVASGLEYLHGNNIIHGDLRAANVLISNSRSACVSSFGISEIINEIGPNTASQSITLTRWQAPELFTEVDGATTASDVWAYAMVCLEIFTEDKPFPNRRRDVLVIQDIISGNLPDRPMEGNARINDFLWDVMQRCWKNAPTDRPSMSDIVMEMEQRRILLPLDARQTSPLPPESMLRRPSTTGLTAPRWLTSFMSAGFKQPSSSSAQLKPGASSISPATSSSNPQKPDLASVHSPTSLSVSEILERHVKARPRSTSNCSLSNTSWIPSVKEYPETGTAHSSPGTVPGPLPDIVSYDVPPQDLHTVGSRFEISQPGDVGGSSNTINPHLHEPCIIQYAKDGSVTCGTLRGLVKQLLTDSDNYAQDLKFREIFFTTYRSFATSSDLFQLLVHRCRETDQDDRVEIQLTTRVLFVQVLKLWLKNYSVKSFEIPLLEEMKSFLCNFTAPQTIATSAIDVSHLIDEMIYDIQDPRPSAAAPVPQSIPRARDITPTSLAIGLKLLDGDKYHTITAFDFASYFLPTRPLNNVTTASITNEKITAWVKKYIMRSSLLNSRQDAFKFFVNTAEECIKLGAFSSMVAVVAGLESKVIARLRMTRSNLDKQTEQCLKKLAKYLDAVENFRAYRSLLSQHNGHCVPWLPVHLKDIHNVLKATPKVIEKDGHTLINFDHSIQFLKAVDRVLRYKDSGYNFEGHRDAGPLVFLEAELSKVHDDVNEEQFEARSLELKKQEDRAFESRISELSAIGFGQNSRSSRPAPHQEKSEPFTRPTRNARPLQVHFSSTTDSRAARSQSKAKRGQADVERAVAIVDIPQVYFHAVTSRQNVDSLESVHHVRITTTPNASVTIEGQKPAVEAAREEIYMLIKFQNLTSENA